MFLNRQQLAMSLSQLVETDYTLLNDILIEYCMMIDDNKLDALEQHVNNNLGEISWGFLLTITSQSNAYVSLLQTVKLLSLSNQNAEWSAIINI